jgi:hypothetical protein
VKKRFEGLARFLFFRRSLGLRSWFHSVRWVKWRWSYRLREEQFSPVQRIPSVKKDELKQLQTGNQSTLLFIKFAEIFETCQSRIAVFITFFQKRKWHFCNAAQISFLAFDKHSLSLLTLEVVLNPSNAPDGNLFVQDGTGRK